MEKFELKTEIVKEKISVQPDLAQEQKKSLPLKMQRALPRVGMEEIELFGRLENAQGVFQIPIKASAFVSLDDVKSRGIHMSRLYRLLTEKVSQTNLNEIDWSDLAEDLVDSQSGLSQKSEIKISGQLPLWRNSLVSKEKGQRLYPFTMICNFNALKNEFHFEVGFEVLYSSTCPCSASLSMEAWKDQPEAFEEGRWIATPHAQRSRAQIRLKISENASLRLLPEWIEQLEKVLGTPVQTLVKRVDELEFAKRNAENLMFAEDAARKLAAELSGWPLDAFALKVEHFESLHAHNAVAYAESDDSFRSSISFV